MVFKSWYHSYDHFCFFSQCFQWFGLLKMIWFDPKSRIKSDQIKCQIRIFLITENIVLHLPIRRSISRIAPSTLWTNCPMRSGFARRRSKYDRSDQSRCLWNDSNIVICKCNNPRIFQTFRSAFKKCRNLVKFMSEFD